jgi:uncharacterized tellurite resistance protein B-like protein
LGFVEAGMLDAFRNLISSLSGESAASRFGDHDYRVAAAALLLHAAAVDGNMSQSEHEVLRSRLKQRFGLDDDAATELLEQATTAERDAVDLYRFTSLLNRSLDDEGRMRIVEMMWEVVFDDGRVSEFEDNLLWRVSDLLGVSQNERIALRHRVAERYKGGG